MQLQDYFAAERKRFPATADIAYFMTASTGLIPDYVHEGISAYQEARYRRGGDSRWRDGEDSMAMMYRSKCQMADMLGCGPEDIAFAANTTQALSYFTGNLSITPGDNVVIPDTLLMAAVMTLTILVTGCGSKNQETVPRTDLNVAMDCDADSLAPWDATLSTTLITRTILFDPLCYYDAQTTTVSYYLAESYTESEDGLLYTFKLKDGVKFSDGSALTADDVVFTMEQYQASYDNGSYFTCIDKTVAVDNLTVEFHLKHAYAPFMINMNNFYVASRAAFDAMGADAYAKAPVGCGQYTLENWKTAVQLDFARNGQYYGTPAALEKLSLIVYADATARATALEAGDVDVASIDVASVRNLESIDTIEIKEAPTTKSCLVAMNISSDTFSDVKVRQAISCAIDKEYIVEATQRGYGTVSNEVYPESVFGYSDQIKGYSYDVEKAKSLLAEAGISTPCDMGTLTCNAGGAKVAEIVQQQLAQVGINLSIQTLETATFYDGVFNGTYDIAIIRTGFEPDASS